MPLPPAYDVLRECARRRIEEEWELTGREQTVLRVIEALSFGVGQMKACIPTQVMLATACGLHRSDVCRALKRLIMCGALSLRRHREETLYEIEVHCDSVPRRTPVSNQERDAAMAALLELQERRQGGRADPSGQERLHGVLGPAEDARLETTALKAELEPTVARGPDPAALDREMADFRKRMAGGSRSSSRTGSGQGRGERLPSTVDLEDYKLGLTGEQQYLWDCLVAEIQRGSAVGLKDFERYAPAWRKRVIEHPAALREAISDHKLRTRGPADLPGAYIWNRMKPTMESSG